MTVEPKKALGQHFLVDENILGVIERMSDLAATDVVLEVGAGLGVLTRYVADRVKFVHAVELDRSLEPALIDALQGRTNVDLIWGDALRLDPRELRPRPSKLVANLPYNVATPLVVETLEHATSLERWCVMVQRELADRFFASPRTKAYGAVSVLVQLAARSFSSLPSTRSTSGIAANAAGSICAAQPVTTIRASGRSRRSLPMACRACRAASAVTAQVLSTTASPMAAASASRRLISDS